MVERHINNMGRKFDRKWRKCETSYFEKNDSDDDEEDPIISLQPGSASFCHAFRNNMNQIRDWTRKYMRSCESKNNRRKNGFRKDLVSGFLKKFNRIEKEFMKGAKNHPEGPLCFF